MKVIKHMCITCIFALILSGCGRDSVSSTLHIVNADGNYSEAESIESQVDEATLKLLFRQQHEIECILEELEFIDDAVVYLNYMDEQVTAKVILNGRDLDCRLNEIREILTYNVENLNCDKTVIIDGKMNTLYPVE